jgi:gliding motility-associated-like protein
LIWWFGDGEQSSEQNPLHYYQNEGLYTITLIAMTDYMCLDTAIAPQQVEAKSQGKIDFPNAFKPSATGPSDGTFPMPDTENSVFHPVFRGVNEYELNIFNRWGELIFVSKDLNIGWDGYYRGELCKQDVYVWKAEGKYINGKAFDFAGDVTLLR